MKGFELTHTKIHVKKIISIFIALMILSSVHSVLAAGSSTDFSISLDSLLPEAKGGTSTDFSVDAGFTNLEADGSSTNFLIAPMTHSTSSSSSSSSVSSSASTITTSSTSSTSSVTTSGGGARREIPDVDIENRVSIPPAASSVPAVAQPSNNSILPTHAVAPKAVAVRQPKGPTVVTSSAAPVQPVPTISQSPVDIEKVSITATAPLRTTDTHPFIAFSPPERGVYMAIVTDEHGVMMETHEFVSKDPVHLMKVRSVLPLGTYTISLHRQDGYLLEAQTIQVTEVTSFPVSLELTTVGGKTIENSTKGVTNLGTVMRDDTAVISGQASPHAVITGYFRSTLRILETVADKDGLFRLPIPSDLESGEHSLTITQSLRGRLEISHKVFSFTFAEPPVMHGAAMTQAHEMKGLLLISAIFLMCIVWWIFTIPQKHTKKRSR